MVAGIKWLLELNPPGRNVEVFADDTFIVSYPKSGNTWIRFLIANLANPERPASFANINELVPDPEALSKRQMAAMPRPRIIKSHQYFDPRFPRVIYLVRDPRDVALSFYHFQRKGRQIADDYPVKDFVRLYVKGDITNYGSWGENVASWLATRHGSPDFLLVRYEDLMEDPERESLRIAEFMKINADDKRIAEAVYRSSADEMRKLEKTQAMQWSSTRQTRQDIPFVRAAKAGNWRSELPAESVALIEAAWAPLMRRLGYELFLEAPSEEVSAPYWACV